MQIKTTGRCSPHLSELPLSKRPRITNAGGDVGRREPAYTSVGMYTGAKTVENSTELSHKPKNTIHQFHSCVYISQRSTNSKRYTHPKIHAPQCSQQHCLQFPRQPKQPATGSGLLTWCIDNVSHKKSTKRCHLQQHRGTERISHQFSASEKDRRYLSLTQI